MKEREAESRANLLSDIKKIVTEVVQQELHLKVAKVEAKVDTNTEEINKIKSEHNNRIKQI